MSDKGQNRTQNDYYFQKPHSALDTRTEKQAKSIVILVKVTPVAHSYVRKVRTNSNQAIMG